MYSTTRQHHLLCDANPSSASVSTPFPAGKQNGRFTCPRIRSKTLPLVFFLSALFCLIPLATAVMAAQVTLAWDANDPAPDGYRLYQRLEGKSYDYDEPVYTGDKTETTVSDLDDASTYYFVVRAYSDDEESGDSNEVSYTTPSDDEDGDSEDDDSDNDDDEDGDSEDDEDDDNQAPVAEAGSNQTVTAQTKVTLDGSESYDPEDESLTYSWSQSSGTPTVTISRSTKAKATFTAPEPTGEATTLAFELTVTDPQGLSSSDTCVVYVKSSSTDDEDGSDDDSDEDGADDDSDEDGADDDDDDGQHAPEQPSIISPEDDETVDAKKIEIESSAFSDPDTGDQHASSEWIISTNWGHEVLHNNSEKYLESLSFFPIFFSPKTTYKCKVRYFDDTGLNSEWSDEISFTTKKFSRRDISSETSETIETFNGQEVQISLEDYATDTELTRAVTYDPDEIEMYSSPSFDTYELVNGLIAYVIEVPEEASSVTVQLTFGDSIDEDWKWYYYNSDTELQAYSDDDIQLNYDENSVLYQLTDGGEDDADGIANGEIVHIIGPRSATDGDNDTDAATSGGGSSSGCFLQSIMQ